MTLTQYQKTITELILLTPPIKIVTVTDIEDLGTYSYTEENLNNISAILQSGEYSKLPKIKSSEKPLKI